MNWKYSILSMLVGLFGFLPSAGGSGELKSSRDVIASNVKRLQPRLTPNQVERISTALRAVSGQCGMPWQLLLSLAFHESSLRTGAVNVGTKDHGLTQINDKTILTLRLDRNRLMVDERYALSAACKVLSENRAKYEGRFEYWLGMYRSGTAWWKVSVRLNAIRYDRMIRRTAAQMGYRPQQQVATNDG